MPLITTVFKGSGVSLISKVNKEMQIHCSKKGALLVWESMLWVVATTLAVGKHSRREGVLFWRDQWLRPARGSVDTKQCLCLQGYLIINKCCQEESNPLLPKRLGYFVSAAGAVAGAAQVGGIQKAPSQAYFYSYKSSCKRSLVLSPCLTCQGFKHPAKFLTML